MSQRNSDAYPEFSKRHLCEMHWLLSMPLDHYKCAVLPAGGPIAMLDGDGANPGAQMNVYNGAGHLLKAWDWDAGKVRDLGWTNADVMEIVTVLEDGRVMLWSIHGTCTTNFALNDLIGHQGVLRCELFPAGIVAVTAALRLVAILSFADCTCVPLAEVKLAAAPTAMAVVDRSGYTTHDYATSPQRDWDRYRSWDRSWSCFRPQSTLCQRRCPDVLLATSSSSIFIVKQKDARGQSVAGGPFISLAPSPDGKFIAAFSANGALLILAADLSVHLSNVVSQDSRPPRQVRKDNPKGRVAITRADLCAVPFAYCLAQVAWCAADAVALLWEQILLVMTTTGTRANFKHSAAPLLRTEVA